jgi:gluconate kinase
MRKARIHIIGGSGSGKSSLAAELARRFGVRACDLDDQALCAPAIGGAASGRDTLADLWRLLRWSHAYDRRYLVEARESVRSCGREVVACTTPRQILAATAHLEEWALRGP